ncbi:MAG: gamma carbonic anhydrase family protein [Desulfobacteraceae bacterium]|nr:gamma carbonic anhydrase family protein [Desulfobacteraceae bacterium]
MGILPYRNVLPQLGENVFIAPGAWVIGDVVIGDNSSVWFNTVVRGDVHYIRIGSQTCVQDNSTLHVTPKSFPLNIGNRVVIGHKAIVHGSTVEDECLIGMNAVILDGCKIGTGSVIAAGSLLPPGFEVPPGSVVMGSPAKIKKQAGDAARELIRRAWSHYCDLALEYLTAGHSAQSEAKAFAITGECDSKREK